jgi:hypothetical protein
VIAKPAAKRDDRRRKLTAENGREIRASKLNVLQLALRFNVAPGTIHSVRSGATWPNDRG